MSADEKTQPREPAIRWYARQPSHMLRLAIRLSPEENGVLSWLHDLIAESRNNLIDDPRIIASRLFLDIRVWNRIRFSLIAKKQIYRFEPPSGRPLLRSPYTDEVIEEAIARLAAARDAGKASARSRIKKSKAKSNQNNALAATPVGTGVGTAVGTPVGTISTGLSPSLTGMEIDPDLRANEWISRIRKAAGGLGWKSWVFEGARAEPPATLILRSSSCVEKAMSLYGSILQEQRIDVRAAA